MPLDMSVEVTNVEQAPAGELPPDCPNGKWGFGITVVNKRSKEDGYPQLELTCKTVQDLLGGNDDFLNSELKMWLTFFPASRPKALRMTMLRIRAIAKALNIPVPVPSDPKTFSWADYADFIAAIESQVVPGYTWNKKGNEGRTEVEFEEPRGWQEWEKTRG